MKPIQRYQMVSNAEIKKFNECIDFIIVINKSRMQ